MLEGRGATLDHVTPKAKGGLTVRGSLVACCLGCNSSKAHTPWEAWFVVKIFGSYGKMD